MSFKEKHALETLPARMDTLRRDIAKFQRILADPGLYTRDPKGFERATAALTTAEAELAQAEERWLELEIQREAADAR
jgi:ATP-binding cassette subfamily F protein uup